MYIKKRSLAKRFIFIVFILYLAFVIISLPIKNPYIKRLGWDGLVGWFYYRGERVNTTFKILKDYPFFGVGLNNYRILFDKYHSYHSTPYEFKIPDNMYLMILGETGIVGFLAFMLFIFSLFRNAFATICLIKEDELREFLIVVIIAIVGILINMSTYELLYWFEPTYQFWILVGMAAAIINKEKYAKTIQTN